MQKKVDLIIKITFLFIIVVFVLVFSYACSPIGRGMINLNDYFVQRVDDRTNYSTLKEVEDTARAMISSYESDRLSYEQYKDSENENQLSWAMQAKNRANKTASVYNNYILKNRFIWRDNIPDDIKLELKIIE